MMERSLFSSRIAYNDLVVHDTYKMGISCRGIGKVSEPGQFAMIRINRYSDPLLCRPFAIHRSTLSQSRGEGIEILYQVVGKGTKLLSLLSSGDRIDGFGPLGRGFQIEPNKKRAIVVAGGIGIASLVCLVEGLSEKERMEKGIVLIGAKTQEGLLCLDVIRAFGWKLKVATEDGSAGHKGLVSDLLLRELAIQGPEEITIYACGPIGMLREAARIATEAGSSCQVSLESQMACGTGACLGCVIRGSRTDSKGPSQRSFKNIYLRTCTEGPVFDASEIAWELL